MAKVAKSALCALSNITSKPNLLLQKTTKNIISLNPEICVISSSRALSSLSSYKLLSPESCKIPNNQKSSVKFFSSEVDKELSSFLQKEIQYETSKAPKDLPTVRGFEISNDGGDVTLTKNINNGCWAIWPADGPAWWAWHQRWVHLTAGGLLHSLRKSAVHHLPSVA